MPLTGDHVRAFSRHMSDLHKTTIVDKKNAIEMQAIAQFVGLLGIGGQTAEEWMRRWSITIGSRIYYAFTPGEADGENELWNQVLIITHEHQHVVQHRRYGIDYYWSYLDKDRRVLWETEAFATASALWHWRKGWVLEPADILQSLPAYGMNDAQVANAHRALDLVLLSIKQGVVPYRAARDAIAWLEANVPDLKEV